MKNGFVLLMALALIGSAIAECGVDCWGLACSENPYTFSTPGNLGGMDCWTTWGGDAGGAGSVIVSGGVCTFTTESYELAFNHDNALADIGITAGVDKIELVVVVDSISPGANAIVKIEQYPAGASFPNPDNGAGAIVTDAWDPDTTITGPGLYSFVTAAVCDSATVAVTPVIGVSNGTILIDEIWIGPEGTTCTFCDHTDPMGGSVRSYDTVTDLLWTNPAPINGTDALGVEVKFEREPGGVLNPNWTNPSTASGTDIVTIALASMTNPPTLPLPDRSLYSWQVIFTDPNGGGTPVVTESPICTFSIGTPCTYQLEGDLDNNCRVTLADFVLLAANWQLDCVDDPGDPACVTP